MKILFINTIDTRGGASKMAYSLKEQLKLLGHSANMYVKHKYSSDTEVYEAYWPSLTTRIIKKITGKDIGRIFTAKLHRVLATDIEWFKTDKILGTNIFKQTDIVHCHNLHGNYFKLDTLRKMSEQKPVLWTLHDMWAITSHCGHAYGGNLVDGFFACPSLETYQDLAWNNEKHLLKEKLLVYERANFHIVVPCLWLKEKVEKSALKNHPLTLIYNGIDSNTFCPQDKKMLRQKLGLPQDKKIILFVSPGGISEEKGGRYFESAVKYLANRSDIIFLCVGQTKEAGISQQTNALYIPFIADKKELAEYYASADIFLFTSMAETFPLTILEAMSCGLPIVSFDVGGVKEAVLHKEIGYIAKYLDLGDILNGIEYILSKSVAEYEKMSQLSRDRILQNFTDTLMTKNYIDLYQKLLKDKR